MAQKFEYVFQWFLPPARPQAAQPPAKTPPPKGGATGTAKPAKPDREAERKEAQLIVQRDRALCDYGYKLLDNIVKDYNAQISAWRIAFSEVVAAYATAVDNRNKILKDAERERERDAAFDSLIFSLMTAGSMRFLGAYLQFNFIPTKFRTYKWIDNAPGFIDMKKVPVDVTSATSSAFGGIAQDIGKALIPLAFPKPKGLPYQMDSWSGIENLRADFFKLIEESSKLVLEQFTEAQNWMNERTEFGAAWAAYAGDDVVVFDKLLEVARYQIRLRFEMLRRQWANEWYFFGKTPNGIVRKLLADKYERSLWAGHLLNVFGEFNDQGYHKRGHRLIEGEVVENVIVVRLKELNVVFAETKKGKEDQANRMVDGSPRPVTTVEDDLDELKELRDLEKWANGYLKGVAAETARDFFPPARARALAPL